MEAGGAWRFRCVKVAAWQSSVRNIPATEAFTPGDPLRWTQRARGCPCPVAGRSLRASCPALAPCWLALSIHAFARQQGRLRGTGNPEQSNDLPKETRCRFVSFDAEEPAGGTRRNRGALRSTPVATPMGYVLAKSEGSEHVPGRRTNPASCSRGPMERRSIAKRRRECLGSRKTPSRRRGTLRRASRSRRRRGSGRGSRPPAA